MKLSQIRNLSWGASLAGVGLCGFLTYQTVNHVLHRPEPVVTAWTPSPPNAEEVIAQDIMGRKAIITALEAITKQERIEVPIKAAKVAPTQAPEKEKKPSGELNHKDLKVTLIAFDDKGGRHMAFLKKGHDPSHPYFAGDDLHLNPPTILKEIYKDYVVLESTDGRTQTITLHNAARNSSSGQASVRSTRSTTPPRKIKKKEEAKTEPAKKRQENRTASKRKDKKHQRFVPKWRKENTIDNYGITVVEYAPTKDGARRFAISQEDLKLLESQPLRLMSEIQPMPVYSDTGDPKGIQLNFLASDPLAKAYGIQDGDVVTHVNGKAVTSQQEAMGIYDGLGNNVRYVPVDIDRGGYKVRIIAEMDDFPTVPPPK